MQQSLQDMQLSRDVQKSVDEDDPSIVNNLEKCDILLIAAMSDKPRLHAAMIRRFDIYWMQSAFSKVADLSLFKLELPSSSLSLFVHRNIPVWARDEKALYWFALFVGVNGDRGALGPYGEKQHAIDENRAMQKEPAFIGTNYYLMNATDQQCLRWLFNNSPLFPNVP